MPHPKMHGTIRVIILSYSVHGISAISVVGAPGAQMQDARAQAQTSAGKPLPLCALAWLSCHWRGGQTAQTPCRVHLNEVNMAVASKVVFF